MVLPAVIVLVVVVVVRLTLGDLRKRGKAEIAQAFPRGGVLRSEPMAVMLGLESRGQRRTSSSGPLVLTQHEIWFRQLEPKHTLRVPFASVLEVSLVRKHLGHSMKRDLVHVRFKDGTNVDSVAWFVKAPAEWRASLEARRASASAGSRSPG